MNAKHTMIATYNARKPIDRLIHNVDARIYNAPAVPQRLSLSQPIPSSGLDMTEQPENLHADESSIQFPTARPSSRTASNVQSHARVSNTRKRTISQISGPSTFNPANPISRESSSGSDTQVSGRKRSRRKCQKCGMGEGCRGNTGVVNCRNQCQDCGQRDCVGRDSRNPKRRCATLAGPKR